MSTMREVLVAGLSESGALSGKHLPFASLRRSKRGSRQRDDERLRVGLLAGTLGQGGAEKQLLYIARALLQADVDVRVYSLTRGEFYEEALRRIGIEPVWIGEHENPLLRLAALSKEVRVFRPHVLQSMHFFTNLYTAIVGRRYGIIDIGSIRSDTSAAITANGRWGKLLLHLPSSLIANSFAAQQRAAMLGISLVRLYVHPNVVDLEDFDLSQSHTNAGESSGPNQIVAVAIGRLIRVKRFERFISAVAHARQELKHLTGTLIGDGPERVRLEHAARSLGLQPEVFRFLGSRDNVPELLKQADMVVLCSESEGFPNVLLEAMAARLPVVATPAGDTAAVVQEGITGYVVPHNDERALQDRILLLAKSPTLRRRLGEAGRERVEEHYSFDALAPRLLSFYREIAMRQGRQHLNALFS